MTRTLWTAALLALMLPPTTPAAESPPDDAEARVARLSKQHCEAVLKADTKALDAMLADDFVMISPFGNVETRADHMKAFHDRTNAIEAIEPREVRVRIDGDAAVVMGLYHIKGTRGGRTVDDLFRVSEVYARREGNWRCSFTQSTRVMPRPTEGH